MYWVHALLTLPKLLRQVMAWARALAFCRAGRSMEASIAMMAMTTRSSISVKARPKRFAVSFFIFFPPCIETFSILLQRRRGNFLLTSGFHPTSREGTPAHCYYTTIIKKKQAIKRKIHEKNRKVQIIHSCFGARFISPSMAAATSFPSYKMASISSMMGVSAFTRRARA